MIEEAVAKELFAFRRRVLGEAGLIGDGPRQEVVRAFSDLAVPDRTTAVGLVSLLLHKVNGPDIGIADDVGVAGFDKAASHSFVRWQTTGDLDDLACAGAAYIRARTSEKNGTRRS